MSLYRDPTIVIKDLKDTCERCRGSGHQPGFSTLGVSQINYDGRCPHCAGLGYRLTELGEDFLQLFRPFLQEMIDGAAPAPLPVDPTEEIAEKLTEKIAGKIAEKKEEEDSA